MQKDAPEDSTAPRNRVGRRISREGKVTVGMGFVRVKKQVDAGQRRCCSPGSQKSSAKGFWEGRGNQKKSAPLPLKGLGGR